MTSSLTPGQVAARLDRLPVSRFHRRFLVLIALGGWFDMFDNFLAGPLAVALPAAGVLHAAEPGEWVSSLGLFMAALPLGMCVGAAVFGMASDYVGRRPGFVAMLLLYSLATLAGGAGYYPLVMAAGTSSGVALLVGSRLLAGAGVGAENVIIDTYVSEVVPRQVRGRAVAYAHAVSFTAFPAAALLARLLAPKEAPHGWWLLMVIGSLGALFTWYFRRRLPESPRWAALVGRHKEAEQTLAAIEGAVEREHGPLPPPRPLPEQPTPPRVPFRAIWAPRYRGRTVMLIAFQLLQTVGYYGFIHWLGRLFIAKGFEHNAALTMQFYASFLAPLGPVLGVWSIERWQRKYTIVALAVVLGTLHVCFGLSGGAELLVGLGAAVIVCSNWFSAVFHAYQAELFPTEARATGVGFTYAWSRVSMGVLNLFMPPLIAGGHFAPYALMAAAMAGVALVVGLFGPLTNDRPLEEI